MPSGFRVIKVELSISVLVRPCCTSWLLWRRVRVSDFGPAHRGSILCKGNWDKHFIQLLHLASNVNDPLDGLKHIHAWIIGSLKLKLNLKKTWKRI